MGFGFDTTADLSGTKPLMSRVRKGISQGLPPLKLSIPPIPMTNFNPKEAQAGYKQIENLLESTDPNAKAVFNILDGYTQAFMTFGYTEEEARARAGTYVGSIYVLGGMSAVLSSNSLTKQFGKDVVTDVKPSRSTTSSFDASEIRFSQNTV